ncbi:hypothetical protein O6H91_Y057100 [Diphasiastrum complanatum]|nr:hypothetical protein O6H91_Y057100 [Diphasiastrum complanatum]
MKYRFRAVLPTFVTFFTLCFSESGGTFANNTVYEELVKNGFPVGLLPETVVDYNIQTNGNFMVHLQEVCSFTLSKTYYVTYGSTISGLLAYGAISHLSGISVKVFFFNLAVSSIYVRGNDLLFEVGFLSTKFPVTSFKESPVCRLDLSLLSSAFTN